MPETMPKLWPEQVTAIDKFVGLPAAYNGDDMPAFTAAILVRFLDKISVGNDGGCWVWIGARAGSGLYGFFAYRYGNGLRYQEMAHRIAYRVWKGPIRPGLQVDHLCRNHLCVSPYHTEAVTASVNVRRQPVSYDVRTTCKRGHLMTPENTYYNVKRRGRECKECRRDAVRRMRLGVRL